MIVLSYVLDLICYHVIKGFPCMFMCYTGFVNHDTNFGFILKVVGNHWEILRRIGDLIWEWKGEGKLRPLAS